jgi:hypothetical protein
MSDLDIEKPAFSKELWVEGLRSGVFSQTDSVLKGDLYDDDDEVIDVGYCCLGVALELDPDTDPEEPTCRADGGSTEMPALWVLEKWGLKQEDADNLAKMNDNQVPFTEIADAIDALPPFVPYGTGIPDDEENA